MTGDGGRLRPVPGPAGHRHHVVSGIYIAVAGRPIKLPLLARSRTPSQ